MSLLPPASIAQVDALIDSAIYHHTTEIFDTLCNGDTTTGQTVGLKQRKSRESK